MKKKLLLTMLIMVMVLGMLPMSVFATADATPAQEAQSATPAMDSDGDGYYEIDTAAKLWWFSQAVNGGENSLNAVLTADIDLSGTCGEGIGSWTPISNSYGYKGHFNGQGHTISGLYITGSEVFAGLFGYVSSGTIENLGVTGSVSSTFEFDTSSYDEGAVGGIVAYLDGGTVRNCWVDMTVGGAYVVGGICGTMNSGTIEACCAAGDIFVLAVGEWSPEDLGGIVGIQWYGTVRGCANRADLLGIGMTNMGGIAGCNYAGTIENCLNYGSLCGENTNGAWDAAGGIVGDNMAIIRNCANYGAITVACEGECVGGIAGVHRSNTCLIANSYSVAAIITGDGVFGPISGKADDASAASNTYYLCDTATEDGGRTAAQFASGQVAYELNGSTTTEESVWRQTLGTDSYPMLSGGLVYCGAPYRCDGILLPAIYSNDPISDAIPDHTYATPCEENCSVCQMRTRELPEEAHSFYYEIPQYTPNGHYKMCHNCSYRRYNGSCTYEFSCAEACMLCGKQNANPAAHTPLAASNQDGTHSVVCGVCAKALEENVACGYEMETAEPAYLKSEANCGHKAVYYKSCICGHMGEETFEAGEIAPDIHVYIDDGNCLTAGICSECYQEIIPAKAAHEFASDYSYNDNGHWHKCVSCDVISEREDHYGQSTGDCTDPVLCACGYVMMPGNPSHSYDGFIFYDETHHFEGCTNCGAPKDGTGQPHELICAETIVPTAEIQGCIIENCAGCDYSRTEYLTGMQVIDGVTYFMDDEGYAITGLVENAFGKWYIQEGIAQLRYDGLVEFEGTLYLIKGGRINESFTGISKQQGVYYYFESGVNGLEYEGLVLCNGMKAYVQDGQVNFNKTGVVEENGQLLYVKYGIWRNTFKGLARLEGGAWVYMENGTFQPGYTGVAKLNDLWVYVADGYVNFNYTGTYNVGGRDYAIKYGVVQF